jgi:hypothetical protein
MGYAPQVPFTQGLKETVRWYQDNRRWWEPLKQPSPGPVRAEVDVSERRPGKFRALRSRRTGRRRGHVVRPLD